MDRLFTRELTKVYNRVPVVAGINLEFKSGEITALLGRNGAGKTTTFLMMAGIVKPDGGEVVLNDENVNGMPSYERSQKGLIYLPQQHSVFMKAAVFDNLFMVLEMLHPADEARRKALELLGDFGLLAVKDSMAHQLSGGEKRRLELARSMIMAPRFLFMDEPFTGIDPITIMDIQKIILRLKARGIGIIITDHNVRDTLSITDRSYVMYEGSIKRSGSPDELAGDKEVREIYLGESFHL